jgi:oxygen-independent coproporphyrinogen-3 oxidase
VQNVKKLSTYEKQLGAGRLPVARGVVRHVDDEIRRHVIHELMCNFRVDMSAVQRQFDIDFLDYFAPDLEALRAHEAEGMVRLENGRIEATAVGELFVRNLALCFDRYWREKHRDDDGPVFSRTV